MASEPDAEWGLILQRRQITSSGMMSRLGGRAAGMVRGHIGRMDNLGIKAGCKKRVKHHSFIRV